MEEKGDSTPSAATAGNKDIPLIVLSSPPDDAATTRYMDPATRMPFPMPQDSETTEGSKSLGAPPTGLNRQESMLPPNYEDGDEPAIKLEAEESQETKGWMPREAR